MKIQTRVKQNSEKNENKAERSPVKNEVKKSKGDEKIRNMTKRFSNRETKEKQRGPIE
jgi:hypothetical protein